MASTDDYVALVTSAYASDPQFIEVVRLVTSVQVRVQNLVESFITLFDVDTAVGDQLDIVGKWAGISRNVSIPATGIFFSWDDVYTLGWDFGVWQGDLNDNTISVLPDSAYRTLIKGKIAANQWNGTTEGAYQIWDSIFTGVTILIQDHQDMSYDLILVGGIVDNLTLSLLVNGYIPLKPEGVRVNSYYIPVNTGPIFAWDVESTYLAGWDEGSWTREMSGTT